MMPGFMLWLLLLWPLLLLLLRWPRLPDWPELLPLLTCCAPSCEF